MKIEKSGNKIRLNITIDPALEERMIRVCQLEDRSMSNLISVALNKYISDYEVAHDLKSKS